LGREQALLGWWRNAHLEAEIARLVAENAKRPTEVKPVAPQGTRAAPTNPGARTQISNLMRLLGSSNEGERHGAASAKKDLHAAADVVERWEKQQEKARPKPPPTVNYSEVSTAITAFVEGKTTVTFTAIWKVATKADRPFSTAPSAAAGSSRALRSAVIASSS
jgi:hypothetical protein